MQEHSGVFHSLPDWLLELEVPEEDFARAYEALPDRQRAWLKTCLARQHAVWAGGGIGRRLSESFRQGFVLDCLESPVDWAVIFFDEAFCAAPRFLAALAPALLSGINSVYVLRICQTTLTSSVTPPALLVAAELAGLAGQGRFFNLPQAEAMTFLRQELLASGTRDNLTQAYFPPQGRLLFLGQSFWGEELIIEAAKFGVSSWSRGMLPVSCHTSDPDAFNLEDFKHLQPDVELLNVPATNNGIGRDVGGANCGALKDMEGATEARKLISAPGTGFALSPGQEGVWFWPELNKDFFLKREILLQSSTDCNFNR